MRDRPGPIAAIIMSLVLIAILAAIHQGAYSFLEFMGAQFAGGFIAGILACFAVYGLIIWIDPASRPRGSGSTTEQKRPGDPIR